MKLEHYKPTGHNLVIEHYEEKELKQGSLFLPSQMNQSMLLGKVLAVGPLCEGIESGDIVFLDQTPNKPMFFEDHQGFNYSINQFLVLGVFKQ